VERSKKKIQKGGVCSGGAATPTSTYLAVEEEGNGKREERA